MTARERLSNLFDDDVSSEKSEGASSPSIDSSVGRKLLRCSLGEWMWVAIFLFCESMIGLKVYPAALVVIFMLFKAYKERPYDFLIMITICAGGYGLTNGHLRINDLLLLASFGCLFLVKKDPLTKKVIWVMLGYVAFTFVISYLSEERFSIQFMRMRLYWMAGVFMIPLLVFANRRFDMMEFMRILLPYLVMICVFVTMDCFVFGGNVLVPYALYITPDMMQYYIPSITKLSLAPLTFPRIAPFSLILIIAGIYPIVQYFKLPWYFWLLLVLALFSVRASTLIFGFVLTFIFFKAHGKKLLLYLGVVAIILPILYNIDKDTGDNLRIASTIDQFTSIQANMSDEQIGKLGTGRMAQFIPKYEVLASRHQEWTGFGFLDWDKSRSHKFMISNNLYEGKWAIDEVVTGVEITQLQMVLDMGWLGLIVNTIVFFGLYFIIRKNPYSRYYLCTIVAATIIGIAGNGGLTQNRSLIPIGIILGCILLVHRQSVDWKEMNISKRLGKRAHLLRNEQK